MRELEAAKNYARQRYVERYFGYSTLGKRFATKSFDDFEPTAGTSAAVKKAREFVAVAATESNGGDKDEQEKAKGLMLIGPVGVGKSHIAAAIFNALRAKGRACIFVNVPELLDRIRASYGAHEGDTEAELLGAIKGCDFLVLDDLGAERHKKGEATDWATEKLFNILDYRYRNTLPVVVTTNCQPSLLSELTSPRIMSRIGEMCDLVAVLGEDYRKRNIGGVKGA